MNTVRIYFLDDAVGRYKNYNQIGSLSHGGLLFECSKSIFALEPGNSKVTASRPSEFLNEFLNYGAPAILLLDLDLTKAPDYGRDKRYAVELARHQNALKEIAPGGDSLVLGTLAIPLLYAERHPNVPLLVVTTSSLNKEEGRVLDKLDFELKTLRREDLAKHLQDMPVDGMFEPRTLLIYQKALLAFTSGLPLDTAPLAQEMSLRARAVYLELFHDGTTVWQLGGAEWIGIRSRLWQASGLWAAERQFQDVKNELWAHHISGGSLNDVLKEPAIPYRTICESVREQLRNAHHDLRLWPIAAENLTWEGVDLSNLNEAAPWRALCQFDGEGRDLTQALETLCCLKDDILDVTVETSVEFTAYEGNCLWCNGVALAQCVGGLVRGFRHVLMGNEFRGSVGRCTIKAGIRADLALNRGALVIQLHQEIRRAADDDWAPSPLPSVYEATGRVKDTYQYLRDLGATIETIQDELRLELSAKIVKKKAACGKECHLWQLEMPI